MARSCSFLASTAASSRASMARARSSASLAFAHDGIGKCPLLVRQHVRLGNDSQHANHRGRGRPSARSRRLCEPSGRCHKTPSRHRWHRAAFPHRRTPRAAAASAAPVHHRRGIAHGRVRRARQQGHRLPDRRCTTTGQPERPRQLRCHGMDNLLLIGAPLQHAVGLEHHMRAAVAGSGLRQGTAQGPRQSSSTRARPQT